MHQEQISLGYPPLENPRAFKNIKTLPVDYYNYNAAWIEIFIKLFFEKYIPQIKTYLHENNLSPKTVLLQDNMPSHLGVKQIKYEDGIIFITNFTFNVTSIAQPMDQGVEALWERPYASSVGRM